MKRVWEIRYQLGSNKQEEQMLRFLEDQRVIKANDAGEIDDIRLVTGMRVKHFGELDYDDGNEMGLTPETDIIDVSINLGSVDAFYKYPSDEDFTIIQVHDAKYLINVRYNTVLQLIRLLQSSKYLVNFSNTVDKKIRDGGIPGQERG